MVVVDHDLRRRGRIDEGLLWLLRVLRLRRRRRRRRRRVKPVVLVVAPAGLRRAVVPRARAALPRAGPIQRPLVRIRGRASASAPAPHEPAVGNLDVDLVVAPLFLAGDERPRAVVSAIVVVAFIVAP